MGKIFVEEFAKSWKDSDIILKALLVGGYYEGGNWRTNKEGLKIIKGVISVLDNMVDED